MDSLKIMSQALEAARTFKPLSPERLSDLLARTAQAAAEGRNKPFKTSTPFDSTAHNPKWLG